MKNGKILVVLAVAPLVATVAVGRTRQQLEKSSPRSDRRQAPCRRRATWQRLIRSRDRGCGRTPISSSWTATRR